MLDPSGWLAEAEALRVGGRDRVDHDCGPGRTLIVAHEVKGYRGWCFRCNEGGFVGKQPTLADLVELRRRAGEEQALRHDPSLPTPMVQGPRDWPAPARLWLYKAGLHDRKIEELGIYYHPPTQRVVLPVVEEGTVTYWQARAVMKGQQPKYINPKVDRESVLPRYGAGDLIVLTEDILSAVRVGEVTEAWSLMGTSMKSSVLARLATDPRPVAVWLDPDKAGMTGAAKVLRSLRTIGVECFNVVSAKDPKLLSKQEILQCLRSSSSSSSGLPPAPPPHSGCASPTTPPASERL